MTFDPKKPYNDLPLLPPNQALNDSPLLLKEAIKAHRELAELKGVANLLPNQGVLLQALNLQEAKFSSEIENIVTTNDKLYKFLDNEDSKYVDPQTKEVLSYKNALWYAYEEISKKNRLLSPALFEEIAQIVTGNSSGLRKLPGTKLENPRTKEVVYTPPEGKDKLESKLTNLENFLYTYEDWDPLIKLAILHYQFEAIHPFYDGNGRTGRILNVLYLVEKGLIDLPIIYLSGYIIENKSHYYELLLGVSSKQNWEAWVLYLLKGVTQTAKKTREKIVAIKKLIDETAKEVKEKCPKIYSKDLVEVLFLSPYCKIRLLEDYNIAKRQAASEYLKELERQGFLESEKVGRDLYFLNRPFLELLIS
jgi:Fic family protein